MIAIFDLDVRALEPGATATGEGAEGQEFLERVGQWARFAALCGLDGIGVVERYSADHAPGALGALQGAPRADEGLIAWEGGARVLPGAEVGTEEGPRAVVFGPPRALAELARDFSPSLFYGFTPRLEELVRKARERGLLVCLRAEPGVRDALVVLGGREGRGVHALLVGPDRPVPRALARSVGRPVAGGSGAVRRAAVGLRRTALALDGLSFDDVRRTFAQGAVLAFGEGGGPMARVARECAAAVHGLVDRVRSAAARG